MLGHEIGHDVARHPARSQARGVLLGTGALATAILTGNATLAANYLANVVLRNVELQDLGAVAFDLLDADRVRVVDQPPCELGQQLSQCSWPSAGV